MTKQLEELRKEIRLKVGEIDQKTDGFLVICEEMGLDYEKIYKLWEIDVNFSLIKDIEHSKLLPYYSAINLYRRMRVEGMSHQESINMSKNLISALEKEAAFAQDSH